MWYLMMNESVLEKALKPIWEAKERFYEENKNLTIRQILEKVEGRPFSAAKNTQEHNVYHLIK